MSDPTMHPGSVLSDTSAMSVAQLAEATNRTFAGYFFPIQHSPHSFARFCCAFHLDLGLSVLLRNEAGELAGLAMLGIRGTRGWCGGFGIVPEFRGHRLSEDLITGFIEQGRRLGLKTLHLEVLTRNTPAIRVYRKAGFEIVRDVLILAAEAAQVTSAIGDLPTRDPYEVRCLTLEEALLLRSRVDAEPEPTYTWQRELASLISGKNVRCRLAVRRGRPCALLIHRFNPANGQISIDSFVFAEEAAAYALLADAIETAETPADSIRPELAFNVFNEPEGSRLLTMLQSIGFRETHRQHEMQLELHPKDC